MNVLLHIVVAGISLFLIGTNIAFLLHLSPRLMPWFTFKISAVTGLLVYVALSVLWGDPAWWRGVIGLAAVVIDTVAIYRMWTSIIEASKRGRVGLVPLLREREERHA